MEGNKSNIEINGNRIFMNDTHITINDNTYKKPSKGNHISVINNTIYVNQYKFNKGKFTFMHDTYVTIF